MCWSADNQVDSALIYMTLSDQLLSSFRTYTLACDKETSPFNVLQGYISECLTDIHDIDTAFYLMNLVPKIRKGQRRITAASMVKA